MPERNITVPVRRAPLKRRRGSASIIAKIVTTRGALNVGMLKRVCASVLKKILPAPPSLSQRRRGRTPGGLVEGLE